MNKETEGEIKLTPVRYTEHGTGFSFTVSLKASELERMKNNELPLMLNAIANRYKDRMKESHGFSYGFPVVFDGREFAKGFIYTFGDVVLGD